MPFGMPNRFYPLSPSLAIHFLKQRRFKRIHDSLCGDLFPSSSPTVGLRIVYSSCSCINSVFWLHHCRTVKCCRGFSLWDVFRGLLGDMSSSCLCWGSVSYLHSYCSCSYISLLIMDCGFLCDMLPSYSRRESVFTLPLPTMKMCRGFIVEEGPLFCNVVGYVWTVYVLLLLQEPGLLFFPWIGSCCGFFVDRWRWPHSHCVDCVFPFMKVVAATDCWGVILATIRPRMTQGLSSPGFHVAMYASTL